MLEYLHGAGIICAYFIVAATIAIVIRNLTKIPDELFRKLLHFILQGSYILFAFAFETWWISALLGFTVIAIAYPIIVLFEHMKSFSSFVNERKTGEFKRSLIFAFTMLSFCNAVCWGLIGDKYFTLACMYAWGIGDAFAALIGKRFGKHKMKMKWADQKKSWEGSAAMFITSSLSILAVLLAHGHAGISAYIAVPIAGAFSATLVELITKEGWDTVTCPLAAMATMIPTMYLLGGFT